MDLADFGKWLWRVVPGLRGVAIALSMLSILISLAPFGVDAMRILRMVYAVVLSWDLILKALFFPLQWFMQLFDLPPMNSVMRALLAAIMMSIPHFLRGFVVAQPSSHSAIAYLTMALQILIICGLFLFAYVGYSSMEFTSRTVDVFWGVGIAFLVVFVIVSTYLSNRQTFYALFSTVVCVATLVGAYHLPVLNAWADNAIDQLENWTGQRIPDYTRAQGG